MTDIDDIFNSSISALAIVFRPANQGQPFINLERIQTALADGGWLPSPLPFRQRIQNDLFRLMAFEHLSYEADEIDIQAVKGRAEAWIQSHTQRHSSPYPNRSFRDIDPIAGQVYQHGAIAEAYALISYGENQQRDREFGISLHLPTRFGGLASRLIGDSSYWAPLQRVGPPSLNAEEAGAGYAYRTRGRDHDEYCGQIAVLSDQRRDQYASIGFTVSNVCLCAFWFDVML